MIEIARGRLACAEVALAEAIGGEPRFSTLAAPCGLTHVRAVRFDAIATRVASVLVGPDGALFGRHTGTTVASLVRALGGSIDSDRLAELIVVGWFDWSVIVTGSPRPRVEGRLLTAGVRDSTAGGSCMLVAWISAAGESLELHADRAPGSPAAQSAVSATVERGARWQ